MDRTSRLQHLGPVMKINYLLLITILLMSINCTTDQKSENQFYENYDRYKQEGLENRRFKHDKIIPLLDSLKASPPFSINEVGQSVLGKEIYLVSVGEGETSVLLWSQMHGDESTATMALMDIFNFFKANDELNPVREELLKKLTIHFIPMLNPDGAEVFKRRNALDIDLNRDALRLQSPEARILKEVRDSTAADFGFNLHDQNTRYTAGKTNKPATISFLAPAFDEAKSINPGRENAMKLIVEMNNELQKHIPGQVAKYSDEFEPRAFGDNIQKWGTNTVLIESGGYAGDPQKQYIRKLNFVAIMEALTSIASKSYKSNETEQYFAIPNNELYLYDLLIRNVSIAVNGKDYEVDLGFNRAEITVDNNNFYYKSTLEDIGDLSVFFGYEELDGEDLLAVAGKIYPEVLSNIEELKNKNLHDLIAAGYTTVRLKELPDEEFVNFPIEVIGDSTKISTAIEESGNGSLILLKDGAVKYGVVNGFIYDVEAEENKVLNGIVRR